MRYSYISAFMSICLLVSSCASRYEEPLEKYIMPPIIEENLGSECEEDEIPIYEEGVALTTINIYDYFTVDELKMMAKTCYGEARGIPSKMEKAAVYWCILNRYDSTGYACGHSIEYVITFPDQFAGYDKDHPVDYELYRLAEDVAARWIREKNGETDVGRVLPRDFIYFRGDGKHNIYRNKYDNYRSSNIWDWSYPDPYTT